MTGNHISSAIAVLAVLLTGGPAAETNPCSWCIHAQALLPDLANGWKSEREITAAKPVGGGHTMTSTEACAVYSASLEHDICLADFDPARTAAVFVNEHVKVTVNYAVLDTPYVPGELSPSDSKKLEQAHIAFTVEILFKSPATSFDPEKLHFSSCERIDQGALPCDSNVIVALRRKDMNSGTFYQSGPWEFRPGEHVISLLLAADTTLIGGAMLHLSDALHAPIPDLHFRRAKYDYLDIRI